MFADAHISSLGYLYVEKPWPIVFFVFFVLFFFSTLVRLSRSCISYFANHKRKKHTKKPPAEQANRKTRQEPITRTRSNVFYRRRDDLIHDHHQRITWHSSSKLVIPEWSHVTSLRLCICHDIFSLVQTWYVVLHLLAEDNSYDLRRGGRYQLKYWGKFLSTV